MVDPFKSEEASQAHQINFLWLVRLRWGAIAGQVLIMLLVHRFLDFDLPLGPLFAVIGIEIITNLLCTSFAGRRSIGSERPLAALLALDIFALTALLFLSGGPMNPFNFLYLVYIALAAIVLRPSSTWALAAMSAVCFGILFPISRELRGHAAQMSHADSMALHLQGMWVAFAVAAGFIVYFVSRVSRGLAEREAELARARILAARSEKLASLATLAAGAAHELSTPLSTIALIGKELEHILDTDEKPRAAVVEDIRTIRAEVDRCRQILDRMAAEAGESPGESPLPTEVGRIMSDAIERLGDRESVRVHAEDSVSRTKLTLPRRAVSEALHAVLNNAQQASPGGAAVELDASVQGDTLRFEVRDRGEGMAPGILARAGEPFFTTKGPGRGMGLGLFLVRAITDRLGGRLELTSRADSGTTVVLLFPMRGAATFDHMVTDVSE